MKLQLNMMKEDLNHRGIEPIYRDLGQQIKGLDKAVRIKQRSDKLKF